MPSVTNKTRKPIIVPLPGHKTLFLGPGRTGQIAPKAVEHPPLKRLVETGEVEILDDSQLRTKDSGGAKGGRASGPGRQAGRGGRQSGDR